MNMACKAETCRWWWIFNKVVSRLVIYL